MFGKRLATAERTRRKLAKPALSVGLRRVAFLWGSRSGTQLKQFLDVAMRIKDGLALVEELYSHFVLHRRERDHERRLHELAVRHVLRVNDLRPRRGSGSPVTLQSKTFRSPKRLTSVVRVALMIGQRTLEPR